MRLVLLGAPGSGKGTQAERLSSILQIPTVSTGNLLREAIRNQTEIGLKAKVYMDQGNLVPDEIVVQMLKDRISQEDCNNGFILDGFPRTIPQAEVLENADVGIDVAISLEVADESIERRMTGRRVCPGCGASYHLSYNPPKEENICDSCGETLVQRDDDKPETVQARLQVYHQITEPIKAFYDKRKILRLVPAEDDIPEITKRVLAELGVKE